MPESLLNDLYPENRIFNALKQLLLREKNEGKSGYVRLMHIQSKFYNEVMEKFKNDVKDRLQAFPEINKDLFDKLFVFFQPYFYNSESVFFRRTPYHVNILDKSHEDTKEVVLSWKTQPYYYVKTGLNPKPMTIALGKISLTFKVDTLELSEPGEKMSFFYILKEITEENLVLEVQRKSNDQTTNSEDIIKAVQDILGITIQGETLRKGIKIFEKQASFDYFIHKNLNLFLKKQFESWLFQHLFSDHGKYSIQWGQQIQVVKELAYTTINVLSQFEQAVLKIWTKPKFVLNSNYIITLDKIMNEMGGPEFLFMMTRSHQFHLQVKEWQEFGFVKETFDPKILVKKSRAYTLNKRYQHLPIDTALLPQEYKITLISLIHNLDTKLDGWLIKSENWQALNSIMHKFKEKIHLIYIDPPYNTGKSFTTYNNKFQDTAWLSMMENRLELAYKILNHKGSMYVRIDYHGNHFVRHLLNRIFGQEQFRNEIVLSRTKGKTQTKIKNFSVNHESLFFYTKSIDYDLHMSYKETEYYQGVKKFLEHIRKKDKNLYQELEAKLDEFFWYDFDHRPRQGKPVLVFGQEFSPPKNRHWMNGQNTLNTEIARGRVRLVCLQCHHNIYADSSPVKACNVCDSKKFKIQKKAYDQIPMNTLWTDIPSYAQSSFGKDGIRFKGGEDSEVLLQRVIESSSRPGDLVLDFFLGSGTSIATAHKLGRKWIGVEMGDHYASLQIPRMKEVLAGSKRNKVSRDAGYVGGGFMKYYALESFEKVLNNTVYTNNPAVLHRVENPSAGFIFLKDKKLLDAIVFDRQANLERKSTNFIVNLTKHYPNIDIAETLSNLYGKMIKRLTADFVIFQDNEQVIFSDLDVLALNPLSWWRSW